MSWLFPEVKLSPFKRKVLDELVFLRNTVTEILVRLTKVAQTEGTQMALLDGIRDAVAANTSVDQSAILLLQDLTARIAALADQVANGTVDPAEVAALAAELQARNAELAAAVVANTPAAPTP